MASTLLFLNLATGEIAMILFVVLLLFGADKIPELARGLGKGMREFKDATQSIQQEIQNSTKQIEEETKKVADDVTKDIRPDQDFN